MMQGTSTVQRRWVGLAVLLTGTAFQFGWLGTCNDRLLEMTNYVDPCGTILGNCNPGDFQLQNAEIGTYCVDPTCTIPGQCDLEGPPLGTTYDLCP